MKTKTKEKTYMFATTCDCCGGIVSIVLPTMDGYHAHTALSVPLKELKPFASDDLVIMETMLPVLNDQCDELIEIVSWDKVVHNWQQQNAELN